MLIHLLQVSQPDATSQQPITVDWKLIREAFEAFLDQEESELEDTIFDTIVDGKILPTDKLESTKAYVKRMGATLSASPGGHCFVNGKHLEMDGASFLSRIISNNIDCGTELPPSNAKRDSSANAISTRKG